jgi:ubiquinone/menaquinone biosynthesis C-methylase UbiE
MSSSIEKFLQDFHKKHPGCTPAAFSQGSILEGLNSYDCLSNLLPSTGEISTVIDLACGDGTLLKNILNRKIPNLKLIGVDMSDGELEVAKSQISLSPVTFIEANAQSLPLADESADFVFCHMAFMLMDNVEQVVREIHRCLKPGGIFSAVIGGKFERSLIYDRFLDLLDEALKEENKKWLSQLGDQRTRSAEGLNSLFTTPSFAKPKIEEFKLKFYEPPTNLMNFFMLMYDVGLLSENRQKKLFSDLLAALQAFVDKDGRMEHFMWLRQITCRRS